MNAQLVVDTAPGQALGEERVASGVYLRNQNQAPVGSFTVTPISGSPRTVLLNGSGSSDFEQRTLTYYWFLGHDAAGNVDPLRPAR